MSNQQNQSERIQFLEEEIKQLNQKLQEKDKQLQSTQKQLKKQEKLAGLGEMSALAFHDLKNHLNIIKSNQGLGLVACQELEKSLQGIMLFMEEVLDDFFDDKDILTKIKNFFIEIDERVEIITKILNDVNNYLNNQEGEGEELQYQEVTLIKTNFNEFVSDCLDSACQSGAVKQQKKGEDKIKLNLETDYDLSINEYLLPLEEIRRILINIIDNSYYAVAEKQKEIGEDYTPTIYLKTQWLNNGIRIVLKDNGQGIPKHIGRKSTHPFLTTKPIGEGTGLGLYIVTKLLDKIKGKMRIKSEENEYTKVTLFIPINQSQQ